MPGRTTLITMIGLSLFGVACDGGDDGSASGGRLVLERDGRTVLDAPATASRCPADSAIAVAVLDRGWAAAFSLRAAWPTDTARTVSVGQILAPGTAVVALRPIGDSLTVALVSARGTLTIEPGSTLSGRIDVTAPTTLGAPDSVRVTGRFTGIRVSDDLCPSPGDP